MNVNISDTYAAQLMQMRQDLLAQLQTQRGGIVSRAESAAAAREQQSDDRAQADAERDLSIALQERESADLVAIDAALQRLSAGHYGLCVDCGAGMTAARLHANPTALRCVGCQEKLEQSNGSHTQTGY